MKFKLIVALFLLVAGCSFGVSSTSKVKNRPNEILNFNKWDLAPIFPLATNDLEYNQDNSLSLEAIGITALQFKNIIDHLDVKVVLPGGEHAAQIIQTGVFAQPLANDECLSKSTSWRISAVRLAPYEFAVPGIPKNWDDWARKQGLPLDQVLQMRLSIKPVCAFRNAFVVKDHALHFTYNIKPADDFLADAVFGSAKRFVEASLARDLPTARTHLLTHLQAINSPAYKQFRADELAIWKSYLQSGLPNSSEQFAGLNEAANLQKTNLFDEEITRRKIALNHPSLAYTSDGQITEFRKNLESVIKRYATANNFSLLTALRLIGRSDAWFMTNLNATSPITEKDLLLLKPELRENAKRTYNSYGPFLLETFVNVIEDGRMVIRKVTSNRYYEDAMPIWEQNAKESVTLDGQANNFKYFNFVDMFTKNVADPKNFRQVLTTFSNPTLTHSTTTSCGTCHALQRVRTELGPRIDFDAGINLHMLGNTPDGLRINTRTVLEIEGESKRLEQEIF